MDEFETYRPLLFSIAYRMLGSASEAEDLVQETYLRYRLAQDSEIRSLKSYLTTIITRLCLDELKSARAQREEYFGPWLPEPLLTDDAGAAIEQRETVSLAFLLLLETLTPPERAVFVLHAAFDYPFEEIGEIIDKNAAACRQLFHRAHLRLAEHRPRFEASLEEQQELTARFLLAAQSGDVHELTEMLARDVVVWADGGGKVSAATRPVSGQDRVIRFVQGLLRKALAGVAISVENVNSAPALLFWTGEKLLMVGGLRIADGQIQEIYGIMNPDKLAYFQRQLQARDGVPSSAP
ncbi:MAG TPA: RNA polymerase sigma-70 factor [Ktedonobacterales bacterium]|nr:RNA polymerase sigma-70 factor [Ktedonobacterales bacterium]